MQKSPQSKVSSQQISALSFIARFNTATVRMTIPFVLAAALMAKYVTTQSARTSAAQPLDLSENSKASVFKALRQ
ncbi:hypothetical protein CEN44_10065, partial [Fischerella muscicola CCMEE 5323]